MTFRPLAGSANRLELKRTEKLKIKTGKTLFIVFS
jgi:hypothetical protein